jgi:hypothetical protein
MIRSMEGFTFATVPDLNMGYYQIKVDADFQKPVFQWRNYKYDCLPTGIKIA